MEITIRNAEDMDLDAMLALLSELFAVEADFTPDPVRQRRGLCLMLDGCHKHRCIKVAEVSGVVVGMCSAQVLISTAQGGPAALVEDVVVGPAYRRLGIGRRLMTAIAAWGQRRGATRLQLLADRNNTDALAFYHKMGWQPTQLICMRQQWKRP